MKRWLHRSIALPLLLIIISSPIALADSLKVDPDLGGYKTVETASTATITRAPVSVKDGTTSPAYLGVLLDSHAGQDLIVSDVDPDSPAAQAGVQAGDILKKLDGQAVKNEDAMLEVLRGKSAGQTLELTLSRQDKPVEVKAILTPWSRARSAPGRLFRSRSAFRLPSPRKGEVW